MKLFEYLLVSALVAFLTACGGGGDGGGAGSSPAQGVLSPTQLYFGNVAVGQTSGPRTATLSNPGGQPLSISRIEYDSLNIANFQVTNNCPATLPPGSSCDVSIVCAPVRPNTGNVTAYVYHNGSRLGGDLQWHLQTYSYVTLTCQ